jgi:cysteine desulfurase
MGYPADLARGALRLTLGRENTDEDVEHAINTVADVVHKLRREK